MAAPNNFGQPLAPNDILQDLAGKVQLLGCLSWLHEFQVLACIPDSEKSSFTDISELANVPRADLIRVVRLTATAGILQEHEAEHVSHSALSKQFLQKPSLLDIVSLMAKDVVPAILDMPEASRRRASVGSPHNGCHGDHQSSWITRSESDPKFKRRLAALQKWQTSLALKGVTMAILSFDWGRLPGNSSVVEVNAQNAAISKALLAQHPHLQVITQMQARQRRDSHSPPLDLRSRPSGSPQTIRGASAYILRLPSPSLATTTEILKAEIATELLAHFNVLLVNPMATLLVVMSLVQDANQGNATGQVLAQTRDLWLFSMTNDHGFEMSELVSLIDGTHDDRHQLVIDRKLSSEDDHDVVFEVQLRSRVNRGNFGLLSPVNLP